MHITGEEIKSLEEFYSRSNMSLSMFRPMEHQEPIFRNYAREYLIRGGVRSGKSTISAVKFAATALGVPVTMLNGDVVDSRAPWQKGRKLRMWVIGYDAKHIGQTIYRLLFQDGLFKIIRDEKTGAYRPYREWEEADRARESEVKKSPPLIPRRFIKPGSWDWENKKGREFKSVTIHDPVTKEELATIYAYSSKADPKAGDPVDVIWIDEAIENPGHYEEWKARTLDCRGNMFWSSWPNVQNDALQKLTERALEQSEWEKPLVREMVIALSQNKTISKETMDEALGMFASDEERRSRDLGEYVTDLLRMYPLYDEWVHQAIRDGDPDEVSRILRETNGVPPDSWTRELVIDPGTRSPAVLFCAIPPKSVTNGSECYVVYDEIAGDDAARNDALTLAKKIKQKCGNKRFHRIIIDDHAQRQTGMGSSVTVGLLYASALKKYGVQIESGGVHFTPGSDNVGGRISQVQEWLHIQDSTKLPKLRIVRSSCKNLVKQMINYKKSAVNNTVNDYRPHPKQTIDAAVCLEYWAASLPMYVPSRHVTVEDNSVWGIVKRMTAGQKKKGNDSPMIGPQYEVV